MLYLGFAAGLRASELVGLRVDDIELDGPYPSILVRGKGRSQRRLQLWKEAARALRAWLAIRGTVPTPALFLNARGEAPTSEELTRLTHQSALRIGRFLERRGVLVRDAEDSYLTSDTVDEDPMQSLVGHSISSATAPALLYLLHPCSRTVLRWGHAPLDRSDPLPPCVEPPMG